jgi:hypothetical protein
MLSTVAYGDRLNNGQYFCVPQQLCQPRQAGRQELSYACFLADTGKQPLRPVPPPHTEASPIAQHFARPTSHIKKTLIITLVMLRHAFTPPLIPLIYKTYRRQYEPWP